MKNLILVLLFFQCISFGAEIKNKPAETKKDTIMNSITIVNNYPDTLKTFVTNQDDSSAFKISDWLTLILIFITIVGLFLNSRSVSNQLSQMSDQIHLMESEAEKNSYRYYYDKWLEMEDKITKDVLLRRYPELEKDEKKIKEVINFIKYLDTQVTYIETSKRFSIYFDEDLTIYKILIIDDYQIYWEKYVRELYNNGTGFTKSIDNTIALIRLKNSARTEIDKKKYTEFRDKLDEESKPLKITIPDVRLKERIKKNIIRLVEKL